MWHVRDWHREQLQRTWVSWIHQYWQHLASGSKIQAPRWLPAPADAGFTLIEIAHPAGQARDWGLSMADGSRIHVHEYADGRRVVHRDAYDPNRGLGHTLAHLMQETPYGILAVGIGAFLLITSASNG
jgi:hypothetical protein